MNTTQTTTGRAREIAHALHIRESRCTGQRNWARYCTVLTLTDGRRFFTENDHEEALNVAERAGALVSRVYSDGAEIKRQGELARHATAEICDRFDSYTDSLTALILEYTNGSPARFVNDLDDAKAYVKNATGAARIVMKLDDDAAMSYGFYDGRGKLLATATPVNALDYIEDSQGARKP